MWDSTVQMHEAGLKVGWPQYHAAPTSVRVQQAMNERVI